MIMVAVHPNDYSLKAVGYTSKGERKEFDCSDFKLYCSYKDLVSLDIPKGVKVLRCSNNKLTELNVTKGLKTLYCDMSVLGLDKVDWDCEIRLY